ncbi:hypothetical protein NHX12_020570, partial [Muraenolepis orangiensis]
MRRRNFHLTGHRALLRAATLGVICSLSWYSSSSEEQSSRPTGALQEPHRTRPFRTMGLAWLPLLVALGGFAPRGADVFTSRRGDIRDFAVAARWVYVVTEDRLYQLDLDSLGLLHSLHQRGTYDVSSDGRLNRAALDGTGGDATFSVNTLAPLVDINVLLTCGAVGCGYCELLDLANVTRITHQEGYELGPMVPNSASVGFAVDLENKSYVLSATQGNEINDRGCLNIRKEPHIRLHNTKETQLGGLFSYLDSTREPEIIARHQSVQFVDGFQINSTIFIFSNVNLKSEHSKVRLLWFQTKATKTQTLRSMQGAILDCCAGTARRRLVSSSVVPGDRSVLWTGIFTDHGTTDTELAVFDISPPSHAKPYRDPDFIVKDTLNTQGDGPSTLRPRRVLLKHPAMTSVLAVQLNNWLIVFVGTGDGQLLKLTVDRNLEARAIWLSAIWKADDDRRVFPKMHLDPVGRKHVLVAVRNQLKRVPVSQCEQHSSLESCWAAGDPYCGWCDSTKRCSFEDECPASLWLSIPDDLGQRRMLSHGFQEDRDGKTARIHNRTSLDEMNSSFFLSQSTPHFPGLELGPGRCPAPGASGGPGGSEMELQKMLIDERMRCENHKTNYQTLKAEHTRLQDEFMRVQGELKGLLGDRQAQQEKLQLLLAELRGELLDKTRQLEESRLQVMTPQRLDLLRAQLQQEMEAPVRERFNKLEEEAERYRSEYNKLRYDYTLFKSQSDYQHQEATRMLEERNMRFEAELSRLEREKEDLVAQYQGSDPSRDARRVEALLREKAQLHLRLKSLEAEVAELRALKDNSGQQAENVHRIQVRQLAESQSAIKSLEAERQSVRLQLERVENELRLAHEQNSQLTGRLHKAEREVNTLTCQVESMKHSHKLEQANVRLECSRTKGEMERERDTLQGQIDALQTDVEVLRASVERQKEVLTEKEREMVRRVQAAREEELHKTAVLHEEKLELETHMSELEQQRAQQDEAGHAHREEWEERLRGAQLGEESARKDLHNLRTRLHQQTIRLEELERTTGELDDLKRQNQELGVRLGTLAHGEAELQASNRRLKDGQEVLREELRTARSQAERSQHDAER